MSDLDKTPDQEVRGEAEEMTGEPQGASAQSSITTPSTEPATPTQSEPPVRSTETGLAQSEDTAVSAPAPSTLSSSAQSRKSPGVAARINTNIMTDLNDHQVEQQIRRISRRSFLTGALGVAAGYLGWRWLIGQYSDNGIPWPFRRVLEINEGFARDYFRDSRLAPTFPRAQVSESRVNGDIGLPDDFDPTAWKLSVMGLESDPATVTLEAIKALPRVEMVTELKCIEGWSIIVHWAGARLADLIAKYPPAKDDNGHMPQYVGIETPDGGYYVGLDMESAMHPQTLLCYEMNGAPLSADHGAPLRLAIPVKYGIKNIKRIGVIRYTFDRPKDYWAERGYDWYAGH